MLFSTGRYRGYHHLLYYCTKPLRRRYSIISLRRCERSSIGGSALNILDTRHFRTLLQLTYYSTHLATSNEHPSPSKVEQISVQTHSTQRTLELATFTDEHELLNNHSMHYLPIGATQSFSLSTASTRIPSHIFDDIESENYWHHSTFVRAITISPLGCSRQHTCRF